MSPTRRTTTAAPGGGGARLSWQVDVRAAQAARMMEAELTANVVDACKKLRVLRYHTYRSTRSPAGFPDEVLAGPSGVLYRELKRQKEKPTPAQQEWLDILAANGCDADVWRPSDWFSGRIVAEITTISRPRPKRTA